MKGTRATHHSPVEQFRRFATTLNEVLSITERLVIRIFLFAAAMYTVYKMFLHR
jgi:hypothetical protein